MMQQRQMSSLPALCLVSVAAHKRHHQRRASVVVCFLRRACREGLWPGTAGSKAGQPMRLARLMREGAAWRCRKEMVMVVSFFYFNVTKPPGQATSKRTTTITTVARGAGRTHMQRPRD